MDSDAAFGLQKLTLLDFPGRMAATVFVPQCNVRCPFCHNAFLVAPDADLRQSLWSAPALFDFLSKRAGVIEGVCITGGEPLLYSGIAELAAGIKACNLAVKLDTNGSFPDRLKELISAGLVDYVAMDIKNALNKYEMTANVNNPELLEKIKKSIELLKSGAIDYEFRTTVLHPLHAPADFEAIGKLLTGAKRYFLQKFVDSGGLLDRELEMTAFSDDEMRECLRIVRQYVPETQLRGM